MIYTLSIADTKEKGVGLFADVAQLGNNSVETLVELLNSNSLRHYSVSISARHRATLVDQLHYDSVLLINDDSILVLSGVLSLMNHSRSAGLAFTNTGKLKRIVGKSVFQRNGEQWQEVSVCYGEKTGFNFE